MTTVALAGGEVTARSRRVRNRLTWGLAAVALCLLVAPLVWLLAGVVDQAVGGWQWSALTEVTTGIGGGLANTIAGTFVLLLGVAIVAGGVGVAFGIYLADVARPGRFTGLLQAASEVLSGVPSIVFGYVGYVALVVGLHWGFSLLPAVLVLSMLVVPYVAKATEMSLSRVSTGYREGAEALGMSRTHMLRRVLLKAAAPGILTGLIIALAISVGETAPLLYTAGFSNSYPTAHLLHAPVPYLTYATWTFWNQPGQPVKNLAYDSSVLLVTIVLLLILLARLLARWSQRYAPDTGRGARRQERGGGAPRRGPTGRGPGSGGPGSGGSGGGGSGGGGPDGTGGPGVLGPSGSGVGAQGPGAARQAAGSDGAGPAVPATELVGPGAVAPPELARLVGAASRP